MRFLYKVIINLIVCLIISLIRVSTKDMMVFEDDVEHNPDLIINNNEEHCSTKFCSDLKPECVTCNFNYSCIYGTSVNATCTKNPQVSCEGEKFNRTYRCEFCYQLPSKYHSCYPIACTLNTRIKTMCKVDENIFCLGNRKFYKFIRCKHTSGYKWSTALILSITLGGFGVDRFYLGDWQEGIGKLFSFGGLGIWTLIDVILIATGYLKPSDGSFYVY